MNHPAAETAGYLPVLSLDGLRLVEEGMKGRVKIISKTTPPSPSPIKGEGFSGNPTASYSEYQVTKHFTTLPC
jgi:hypothetical protein